MVKYFVPVLVGLFFIHQSIMAQTYDLNQFLDSALQNNYLIQSTEKNKIIKQSEIEILQTNYLPKVSASASFSYWKFLLPNKQKLLDDALTDMYTDITFYQTLYDFGQNKAKKSIVDDEIKLNNEIIRQIRQTVIWGVTDAYFEVLSATSEIDVHESSLFQLQEHLRFAEHLYQIGKTSLVDILKIKVQISVEENKLEQSRNKLIERRITLFQLSNIEKENGLSVENNSEKLFQQYENSPLETFGLISNLNNHPSLKPFDIKSAIEGKQQQLIKLQNRPELFSYGIGSWEHGYVPFGANFNYNIGVGIRYTFPYWGNSGYRHKIKQSRLYAEQYDDQKQQLLLEVKKEIELCLNTLDEIQKNIKSNKEIIDLAKETISSASVKYRAGQGNIIDILDAQQILTEAAITRENAKIAFLQSLARLHYLRGNDHFPFNEKMN